MTGSKTRFLGMIAALALTIAPGAVVSTESSQVAPNFTVQNLNGGAKLILDNHLGKVVYVDFWASWCGPCLKSFPFMESLYQEYADDGFEIIAINMDQDPADAVRFLDEHPVTFLIGQDRIGAVAEQYDVQAMPSSFLIDREGNIRSVHYGFKSSHQAEITAAIESLL